MKEYKPGTYMITRKKTGLPIGMVVITTTGRCFEAFAIGTTDEYIGGELSTLRAFERLSAMERHYTVETLNAQETKGQADTGGEHVDGSSILGIRPVSAADGIGAVASSAAGS